jgi:hypothetical protein
MRGGASVSRRRSPSPAVCDHLGIRLDQRPQRPEHEVRAGGTLARVDDDRLLGAGPAGGGVAAAAIRPLEPRHHLAVRELHHSRQIRHRVGRAEFGEHHRLARFLLVRERVRDDLALGRASGHRGGQAVVVEREAGARIAQRPDDGRRPRVEQDVGLVADQRPAVASPDRLLDAAVERGQLRVERRAAGGREAARPRRPRERLVEQLVAEQAGCSPEPRCHVTPRRRVRS